MKRKHVERRWQVRYNEQLVETIWHPALCNYVLIETISIT